MLGPVVLVDAEVVRAHVLPVERALVCVPGARALAGGRGGPGQRPVRRSDDLGHAAWVRVDPDPAARLDAGRVHLGELTGCACGARLWTGPAVAGLRLDGPRPRVPA